MANICYCLGGREFVSLHRTPAITIHQEAPLRGWEEGRCPPPFSFALVPGMPVEAAVAVPVVPGRCTSYTILSPSVRAGARSEHLPTSLPTRLLLYLSILGGRNWVAWASFQHTSPPQLSSSSEAKNTSREYQNSRFCVWGCDAPQ